MWLWLRLYAVDIALGIEVHATLDNLSYSLSMSIHQIIAYHPLYLHQSHLFSVCYTYAYYYV